MATPTPWVVAARKAPTYTKSYLVNYDRYNFSYTTTTNGTNPVTVIPCTGPGSAGAIPPSSSPQVTEIIVSASGTNQPEMGCNFHQVAL